MSYEIKVECDECHKEVKGQKIWSAFKDVRYNRYVYIVSYVDREDVSEFARHFCSINCLAKLIKGDLEDKKED